MRYSGFEREHISSIQSPSLEDLERYGRYSEIEPILKCLKYAQEEQLAKYSHHKSRFVRQEAAKYVTDYSIINSLKKDVNYFVRAEVFRNKCCFVSEQDVEDNKYNELVLSSMAQNTYLCHEVLRKLVDYAKELSSFLIRFQLIRYQSYSKKLVKELKKDFEHYGLTLAEVLNKGCPIQRQLEIANNETEKEVLLVLARVTPSIEVHKSLLNRKDSDIDIAMISENIYGINDAVLEEGAISPDFEVRTAVANNKRFVQRILSRIDDLEY